MQTAAHPASATTEMWLKAAAAIVIGFGAVVGLAAHPATADLVALMTDILFWPIDGNPKVGDPATRLLAAISGGLMVGWGVMLWLTATRLYPRDPGLARTLVTASTCAWFVTDSLGSFAAGAPLNALANVGFLAVLLIPFAFERRS